ncbi:ribbon-helix-helix protein, CopG family [Marinifilum sp. JC120]|nr:ribbon-helix-helix protein, CopG family [Marinifilum sp. JC120]
MIEIRVEPELEQRLDHEARISGKTREECLQEALSRYLEDREDYREGIAVLESGEPFSSLEDVEKRLDLEN